MAELVKFLASFAEHPGLAILAVAVAIYLRLDRTMTNGNHPVAREIRNLADSIHEAANEVKRSVDEVRLAKLEIIGHREDVKSRYPPEQWRRMVEDARSTKEAVRRIESKIEHIPMEDDE